MTDHQRLVVSAEEFGRVLDELDRPPEVVEPILNLAGQKRASGAAKTPIKCFRIPQDLYERAQAKAAERGESLSEAVREFLERYSG